jgi:hypothetical protein
MPWLEAELLREKIFAIPLQAVIESIIPPLAIVDGLVRGGLLEHKIVEEG